MNGSLPIARPRSYFLFLSLLLENYYENLFGFFIKPKRFARSRHGYISKRDETRVNLVLFSLIQCPMSKKRKWGKREIPATLSSVILHHRHSKPDNRKGRRKTCGREEEKNTKYLSFWTSSPSFPTTANFQFLRQRASHIVGGNSCCNSVRWNEDRSKEWSNLRGGFVRWKAANNLMQIRGDLVGEVSGGRGERSAPPVR